MKTDQPYSIAVVLTCFNRREKTAACLRAIKRQAERIADRCVLRVIVTDDGSTDGTSEMLAAQFPRATVIRGDGNLFWSGGMREAFGRALQEGHDFYLWLNDDVELFPRCLETLLDTHEALQAETRRVGIVVGSMCNGQGEFTYGGLIRKVNNFIHVAPSDIAQPCDTLNGNCVLIARGVAERVGNMDSAFRHGIGDMDYGLRATKVGIPIRVMPGFAGCCIHDHWIAGSYLDRSLSLSVRWKKITSAKGLAPYAWWIYSRRHFGWLWPAYWVWPYVKVVWTSIAYRLSIWRNTNV